jgi:hypothetical protein
MTSALIQAKKRNTHFVFEHNVFSVDGAYFAAPEGLADPKFYMPMGEVTAIVSIDSLIDEFDISSESPDGRLLDVVGQSLKFVKTIRPNDSIPNEILDGSASWAVEEHHRLIARGRITAQLIALITGEDNQLDDFGQLEQMLSDPKIKERLDEAFGEIANKLGLGPGRKQDIVDWIEHLAHEMSYIEALREYKGDIDAIAAKLKALQRIFANDRIAGDIDRSLALIQSPLTEYANLIDQLDGQTCELMVVLRDMDRQVKMIRNTRDQLHYAFLTWDEIATAWQETELEASKEVDDLIKSTYRFLATNFEQSQNWALMR